MWPFGYGNKYPYTDFHELNADWILGKIRGLEEAMKKFVVDTKDTIIETVNKWLDDHPEATTTVQDGSITSVKMQADFLEEIENPFVTPEMFGAVGDGVTDDTQAFIDCFNSGKKIVIPQKSYLINSVNPTFDGDVIYNSGEYPNVTPVYNSKHIIENIDKISEVLKYDLGFTGYVEAITYNTKNDRLIIACYNYQSTPKTTIIVMNPNTLVIDNQYDLNYSIPNAISYNEDDNEILLCCYSNNPGVFRFDADTFDYKGRLSTVDQNIYWTYDNYTKTYASTDLSNNVYTVNIYDSNFNLIKSFSRNIVTNAHQDICYRKGIIYQLTWNKIIIINVITGDTYYLGLNSLVELEGITFVGDVPFFAYHNTYVDGIEYIGSLTADVNITNIENLQNKGQYLENTDLNTILVDGVYRVHYTGSNDYHFPGTTTGGMLIVTSCINETLDIQIINQTYIDRSGSYQHIFTRSSITHNASSWSNWFTLMRSSRMLSAADTAALITANSNVISSSRLILTYSNNLVILTGWILISNDTIASATPLLTGLPKGMGSPVTAFLQDQNNNLSYVVSMDYNTDVLKAGRPMNNLSGHYLNISIIYPLDETL